MQTTRLFLKKQLWAWPIIAAMVLFVLGLWVNRAVEGAIKDQVAGELKTIRIADVEALRIWLKQQESNAAMVARERETREVVLAVLAEAAKAEKGTKLQADLLTSPALANLREHMQPRLKMLGYTDFFLVDRQGMVLGSRDDLPIGKTLGAYRSKFFLSVIEKGPHVSVPYRSPLLLPDENGELQTGLPQRLSRATTVR